MALTVFFGVTFFFKTIFTPLFSRGVPGEEFFLDHVHPAIEGHHLLGEALYVKMMNMGICRNNVPLSQDTITKINDEINKQIDTTKHGIALRNLAKVLSWAGKNEDGGRLARKALYFLHLHRQYR